MKITSEEDFSKHLEALERAYDKELQECSQEHKVREQVILPDHLEPASIFKLSRLEEISENEYIQRTGKGELLLVRPAYIITQEPKGIYVLIERTDNKNIHQVSFREEILKNLFWGLDVKRYKTNFDQLEKEYILIKNNTFLKEIKPEEYYLYEGKKPYEHNKNKLINFTQNVSYYNQITSEINFLGTEREIVEGIQSVAKTIATRDPDSTPSAATDTFQKLVKFFQTIINKK